MARKNRDFRPDKIEAGILNKLYLTKKQRLSLLRWFLFGAVLLVLSLLQDVILCKARVFGATTDLVPCAILLICVLLGTQTGCVFTLVASLVYLFSGSSPGYYVMALLTGLGVLASMLRQGYLRKGFGSTLLCAGGAMMLYELAVFAITLVFGLTTPGRIFAFVLTGLLSLLAIPVLYPILLNIDKIGGETWKE